MKIKNRIIWITYLFLFNTISFHALLYAQNLTISEFANHYIILIDGSNSIVSNDREFNIYRNILLDVLPQMFFDNRFKSIPSIQEQDILSILRFGIVPRISNEESSVQYLNLKKYKMLDDFIHTIHKPASINRINFEKNMEKILYQQKYWYSFLLWAKPLSLHTVRNPDRDVKNTYLIVLRDKEYNGSEDQVVKDYIPDYKNALNIRDQIYDNGYFSNENLVYDSTIAHLTIEGYIITSIDEKIWSLNFPQDIFKGKSCKWENQWGSEKVVNFFFLLSDSMQICMQRTKKSTASIVIKNANYLKQQNISFDLKYQDHNQIPIRLKENLKCNRKSSDFIKFIFLLVYPDSIIGNTHYNYIKEVEVTIPPLSICTFTLWFLIIFSIIILVISIISVYYLWNCRVNDFQLVVSIWGLYGTFKLHRNFCRLVNLPSNVNPDTEILTIVLQTNWFTHWIYNTATIGINDGFEFLNSNNEQLENPLSCRIFNERIKVIRKKQNISQLKLRILQPPIMGKWGKMTKIVLNINMN